MEMYQSSLGKALIIVSTDKTALVKTGKEFVVVRYPSVEDGYLTWGSGRYFDSFSDAVNAYQESK